MTADNLFLLVVALLWFGLTASIIYLGRRFQKREAAALLGAVVHIIFFIAVFLYGLARKNPDTANRLYAEASGLFSHLRWYYPLLLAALGSVYTTASFYRLYRPTERLVGVFVRAFANNSVNLLILYFLYALTGSLPLTGVAAAASVILGLSIRFFVRHIYFTTSPGGVSDDWLKRIQRLLYVPVTLLPSAISLLTFVLLYRQPPDASPATDSPNLIWPLVLFLLMAAVNFTFLIKDMSPARSKDMSPARRRVNAKNAEYASSQRASLVGVSLVRIFVLALFVIPAGLAAGGGWRAGAFTALFGYALLELCAGALHARAAARAFRLMSGGQ